MTDDMTGHGVEKNKLVSRGIDEVITTVQPQSGRIVPRGDAVGRPIEGPGSPRRVESADTHSEEADPGIAGSIDMLQAAAIKVKVLRLARTIWIIVKCTVGCAYTEETEGRPYPELSGPLG